MSRPAKAVVDYFPHSCNHKKTMYILESKYKNDGYAFWFKLLEILGQTENHFYNCNVKSNWEFLLAKTLVNDDIANDILDTLSELDAIDPELWQQKIIWCQNFIDNIKDVYKRRCVELPTKDRLMLTLIPVKRVSAGTNPQSKVKETKVKESKENTLVGQAQKILQYLNKKKGSKYKDFSFIEHRLKDGKTAEECIQVIDNKLRDPYFIENPKFLCPETIFRKTKFDKNLNDIPHPLSGKFNKKTIKNIEALNQWEKEELENERQD